MITMLVSVVLNVLLAPLFVFVLRWGMMGAAVATVISQGVSAVWVLAYFVRGDSLLKIRSGNLRPRGHICSQILTVGSPPFAMQLAGSVTNSLLFNQLRVHGGDAALSIIGIIFSIVMFIAMPIMGINHGAQPIIGHNYGAREFARVRATLKTAILGATAITGTGFVLTMIFPGPLFELFGEEAAALVDQGAHAVRICLSMLPIVGFQIVSAGYFQAVGKPKKAMLLSLSRQVLLLIPAVFILPRIFGLDGVWAALPVSDLGSSLWTGLWLWVELRDLRSLELTQELTPERSLS